MSKSGIYKIQSTINSKFYIGSAERLNCRKNQHFSDLRLNKHYNKHLQRHYNKYGKDSLKFLVIEECEIDDLVTKEQYYIDTLKPKFNGRKIAESNRGHKFSEKTKKNMSIAQKKWRNGRDLSITLTKEVKNRVLELKKQGLKNREIHEILNISMTSISNIIKPITKYKFKLSTKDILEIKNLVTQSNLKLKEIAKLYNLNPSIISNIKAGRLHKNIQ